MNIKSYMEKLGKNASKSARELIKATTAQKNDALLAIADNISSQVDFLQKENNKDLHNGKQKGLDSAMLDRLKLSNGVIESMVEGLRQISALPDPVGEITDMNYRPSGIQVGKMRAPLGVVGIIYESRPNVTVDAAALCLKSGNATILRGGSEAKYSNQALKHCIHKGLEKTKLSINAVQVVETTDRDAVGCLINMPEYVDVIIPRGGKSLIQRISEGARVPVIKHLDGICHVYIDDDADIEKAIKIADNSKTQRYGVCNTMETLLVSELVSVKVLPELSKIYQQKKIELRGCKKTASIIPVINATEEDWQTEYLAPILSIRVVKDIDEAMNHIHKYSSGHTESIVTENFTKARRFLAEVNSSSVMVNTSTRFADGFEYGLGAEIGISTDKFHVRGPVGLEGLTSQKWIVLGDGSIRV